MAPRESATVAAPSKEAARKALDISKIREAIPKEAFKKGKILILGGMRTLQAWA